METDTHTRLKNIGNANTDTRLKIFTDTDAPNIVQG